MAIYRNTVLDEFLLALQEGQKIETNLLSVERLFKYSQQQGKKLDVALHIEGDKVLIKQSREAA
ncbi:hypothetical protein PVT67_15465 [Gallaecimonas kandeliae]|uniref:hypothetical protein n=1 Tax=Gallaecimonas kandeliae TaxID=3029055 RepID=UPI002648EE81|nr:hypothetical protein [Gallaecimonas kandeliae]WKE65042.1 hypothetical protein PVT67_15465 [Gallaecimonas kandeliae]